MRRAEASGAWGLAALLVGSASLAAAQGANVAPGVVLVGLRPTAVTADGVRVASGATVAGDTLAAQLGGVTVDPLRPAGAALRVSAALTADGLATADLSSVVRLRLRPGEAVDAAVRRLQGHPLVAYVEPDYVAHILATPDDPLFGDQWGLAKIEAPAAWDVTTGVPTVPIAVIDAGLEVTHPDLAGQLWRNPGEVAGNGVDDDGNGYVDDLHGWNLLANNADLSDTTGHGTEVAGIVAAASNNALGGAGVCGGCRVMVVKVVQAGGTANYSDIAAGVLYAAQKGARVINLSLGGTSDSVTLRTAIAQAAQTATVVAGVGNANAATKIYPAAYDEHVIAVAGTGPTDAKAATSSYGTWVDLAAPGEQITTTFPGGSWGGTSGTSMAAPFVAGVAGLVRSAQPGWSGASVRQHLLQTADDTAAANPAYAGQLGTGRVNARRAVTTAAAPVLTVAGTTVSGVAGGTVKLGVAVPVVVTLRNAWLDAATVTATLGCADAAVTVGKAGASFGAVAGGATGSNAADAFTLTMAAGSGYGRAVACTLTGTADGTAFSLPVTLTTEASVTTVSGAITASTTWTSDRSYLLTGNARVMSGVTLTIQPGTVVRFAAGVSLDVRGTLVARGTPGQPIVFTSAAASPARGDWGGVILESAVATTLDGDGRYLGGSVLEHAVIEYGQGVRLSRTAVLVSTCRLLANTIGVDLLDSGAWVVGNSLRGNGVAVSLTSGGVTMRRNLVEENDCGLRVLGTAVGPKFIWSNTFTANGQCDGRAAVTISATTNLTFRENSLLNAPSRDLATNDAGDVDASGNYWGTLDEALIAARILDATDDLTLGVVHFQPLLTSASPDAPAVLDSLTLTPTSPVGIQTVTLRAKFSGPMDTASEPQLRFASPFAASPQVYTSSNSSLPEGYIRAIEADSRGRVWVATGNWSLAVLDGGWQSYDYRSLVPAGYDVLDMTVDAADRKWVWLMSADRSLFVVLDGSSWRLFNCGTDSFACTRVATFTPSPDGRFFIAQYDQALGPEIRSVAVFSGTSWSRIDVPAQHHVPNACSLAVDRDGGLWIGYVQQVKRLHQGTWSSFSFPNVVGCALLDRAADGAVWGVVGKRSIQLLGDPASVALPLPQGPNGVGAEIRAFDAGNGEVAAVADGRLYRLRDGEWTSPSSVSTHMFPQSQTLLDDAGAFWTASSDVRQYASDRVYAVPPGRWLDDRTYEAPYEFTSLVPRGDYVLTVSGARDQLGFDTPAATTTFTVDYAGTITDRTPPVAPVLIAAGKTGNPGAVEARWAAPTTTAVLPPVGSAVRAAATDPSVTGYRYAIGTAAGATDVVNWTDTTATAVSLSGLGLIPGQQYYLTLQARNAGGLWSASTISPFVAGTGFRTAYLAEGATGAFFDLDIALANPAPTPVSAFVTFLSDGGAGETLSYVVPAQGRITVRADAVAAVAATAVSTVVEAAQPLIVERTMFWDAQDPTAPNYGGHGGNAVEAPSRVWYFAEGSQGFFDTWVLLANPGETAVTATVTFLLDNGPPLAVEVPVEARRRATVFAGAYPRLVNTSFAITVTADQPLLAERAMYFGGPPRWRGGHESPGTTTLATRWSLVEGATGDYFDTWVLVGNPNDVPVDLTFTFLLGTPYEGTTYVFRDRLGAKQRYTLNPETLVRADAFQLLGATAVSTVVEASAPVVVERAMYWPGSFLTWAEAHNSLGVTETGTRWGLAEGRIGGPAGFETYLLLANADPGRAARVRLTFLREAGAPVVIERDVPAASRNNVYVNNAAEVPGLVPGERFGVLVESLPVAGAPAGVPISVERALYWNAGTEHWAGGTNALATKLP